MSNSKWRKILSLVVVGEALLGEEPAQHVEVIPGIQGQKSQLTDQGHGTVFDAEKEIGQVTVVVVIDFHGDRRKFCVIDEI